MPFLALAFFISLGLLILAVLGYALWLALPELRKKRAGAHPLDANIEAEITPPPHKKVHTESAGAESARSHAQGGRVMEKATRRGRSQRHLRRRNPAPSDAPGIANLREDSDHRIGSHKIDGRGLDSQGLGARETNAHKVGMRPQGKASVASAAHEKSTHESASKRAASRKTGTARRHLKAVRSPEREAS